MFQSEKTLVWRTAPETRATAVHDNTKLVFEERSYFLGKFYRTNTEKQNPSFRLDLDNAIKGFQIQAGRAIAFNIFNNKLKDAKEVYRYSDEFISDWQLKMELASNHKHHLIISFVMWLSKLLFSKLKGLLKN